MVIGFAIGSLAGGYVRRPSSTPLCRYRARNDQNISPFEPLFLYIMSFDSIEPMGVIYRESHTTCAALSLVYHAGMGMLWALPQGLPLYHSLPQMLPRLLVGSTSSVVAWPLTSWSSSCQGVSEVPSNTFVSAPRSTCLRRGIIYFVFTLRESFELNHH